MTLNAFSVRSDRLQNAPVACRQADLWRPFAAAADDETAEPSALAPEEEATAPEATSLVSTALLGLEEMRKELEARMDRLEGRYRHECASSLAQIISAAAPSISEAAARDAIAAVFAEERKSVRAEILSFVVSPDLHDVVQSERLRRSIDLPVEVDESLEPGAMRIRWPGGGLDCDVGRSLFAIVDFLSSQPQTEQK
jgi:hypothetical protein